MEQYYQRALEVMEEIFGHDVVCALATCAGNSVSVRDVDCYYKNGKIYIMTYADTRKMRDIAVNPNVALCRQLATVNGRAYNLGHPLLESNAELRAELKREFALFYKTHVDENSENACILAIDVTEAVVYTKFHRYCVDFVNEKAERDHYVPDILT